MSNTPHERPVSFWTTLGWAVYLACSWTWCIGMFLPVLLMRDFGLWGFVVFAVPNVVGAAALGWVLSGRHQPKALLEKHQSAVRAFAIVTIVFQAYLLGVLLDWAGFLQTGSGALLVLIAAVLLIPVANRARWLALAVLVLSAGCAVMAWRAGSLSAPPTNPPPLDVLWLAPVCAFGFALCPYLDPTFLRAAESLHGSSRRLAFSLGFGFFFLSMILFTLAYGADIGLLGETALSKSDTLRGVIFLHIGAQLTFTMLVHIREMGRMRPRARWPWILTGLAIAIALFGATALNPWPDLSAFAAAATSPELYYRLFLSFYGLVFPAYVWICMIPTADSHAGLTGPRGRRKLLIFCGSVGAAAPFFWMGFIKLEEFFLVPGMLIVLLARLAVRRSKQA